MTTTTNDLQTFLRKKIYHWVGKNFGLQEADDPSWNIEELSAYLAKELDKNKTQATKMKPYELTVLFRTEVDAERELEKVKQLVKNYDGKVVSSTVEGEKRLAYRINNNDYAIYTYLEIELPEGAPAKLSSTLNIKDEVLRYLLVQADTRRR